MIFLKNELRRTFRERILIKTGKEKFPEMKACKQSFKQKFQNAVKLNKQLITLDGNLYSFF